MRRTVQFEHSTKKIAQKIEVRLSLVLRKARQLRIPMTYSQASSDWRLQDGNDAALLSAAVVAAL